MFQQMIYSGLDMKSIAELLVDASIVADSYMLIKEQEKRVANGRASKKEHLG